MNDQILLIQMGNEESQFEYQFHKLYNFVGVLEDPLFHMIKIYRKNKFSFDYIMVAEKSISELTLYSNNQSPTTLLQDKLSLIRKYQTGFTTQLQYWRLLEQKAYECGSPLIRLYMEYYNHTLQNYLSALRTNGLSFSLDELVFVIRSLAEAMLALRKMNIDNYKLELTNIFVSADQGKVVLNPTYFLYQSVHLSTTKQALNNLTTQYEAYPSNFNSFYPNQINILDSGASIQQRNLHSLQQIFLEMTRYINTNTLSDSNNIFFLLKRCQSLIELMDKLPPGCDELNVQQFGQNGQQRAQLYPRQE